MPSDQAMQWLHQLRMQASEFDMRNAGGYRSEYLLDGLFFDLVRLAGPDLFLEVGAHDGQRAVAVKRDHPSARVVALEASPDNFATYTRSTDFSALGVEYVHAAACERDGEVTFNVQPGAEAGNSSLLERHDDLPSRSVKVPGVTLDSLLGSAASVCMWVDVEGATQQVLAGASSVLESTEVVKIEVEELDYWKGQWSALQVVDHLLSCGLVPVARDRIYGDGQYNIVFVSRSMFSRHEVGTTLVEFAQRARVRELPGPLGRLRRDPRLRSAARGLKLKGR